MNLFLKSFCFFIALNINAHSTEFESLAEGVPSYAKLAQTDLGCNMYVDKRDGFVSESISSKGTWQVPIANVLRKIVHTGDIIVHLGAHIGYFDLLLGKLVGEHGEIYSFEANPETYPIFASNIKLNDLQRIVRAYNKAVFSCVKEFEITCDFGNTGGATLAEDSSSHDARHKLTTVILDDELKDLANVNLIFMDIEGSEIEALKGGEQLLSRSPNALILMEYHPYNLNKLNSNIDSFINDVFLAEKKVFHINWDGKIYPVMDRESFKNLPGLSDVLIVPKSYDFSID